MELTESTEQVLCERCGYPVKNPVTVHGYTYHQGPQHCDQITQAHEVADFIADAMDDVLGSPAMMGSLMFADGRWRFEAVSVDKQHVRLTQADGEPLGEFLLRISGGLLPLP